MPADPGSCPFCRKLKALESQADSEVVRQFPQSVAYLGNWQYYHGYCILIARRHVTELFHLSDEDRHAYFDEMCLLARAIADCFKPVKLNYELLGNQVPHLHWHLLPRYGHDPQVLHPAWIAINEAEGNQAQKRRLESGPIDRDETSRLLRQQLSKLSAP